jgi:recombination protein RecT
MASNAPANGDGGGNNGRIIPYNERFQSFGKFIETMKPQLGRALPKHVTADRMTRIILTTVQRVPELLECTPQSMLGAVLQCAQLGLEPDGVLGQAYLIPFNNRRAGRKEVQLIVGYKGLVKLAYQSGEVGAIRARVVRERDRFEYSYGLDESLIHEPWRKPDAGPLVAVYAVAKLREIEDPQFLVLERWEVDEIRKRSKASDDGPWKTDYDEMAKKSALRRLCKMLPASVEKDNLARAIALDERAEADVPQDLGFIDVGEADAPPAQGGEEGGAKSESQPPSADGGTPPAGGQGQTKLDELANRKKSERGAGTG